jgi:D-inositol-3-phosphate glycosyltransferase
VISEDQSLERRALQLERGSGGVLPLPRRVCMLSLHTCPLAAPGGKESGGMNVYVRELSRQLGRRGCLVDAFTRSESAAVPHIRNTDLGPNVRVIHVVAGPEAPLARGQAWDHATEFVAGVKALCQEEGLTYDLYHSHYWMSGWAGLQLAAWRPAPLVHMYHTLGVMKDLAAGPNGAHEPEPRRSVERRIALQATRIVAATPLDKAQIALHCGADPERIEVISPGVDLELFRPISPAEASARLGHGPGHRMVLFVGRLDPVKGLDTLVLAMAKVVAEEPSLRGHSCLCIVGGDKPQDPDRVDAERARIDRLARDSGLGDVIHFMGSVSQDDLPYYYSAAQVVVVPSRYESFGMVALEAMACGAPVIASDVGGLSTLVRDGRTGFLVPDGDADALARRLLPLLRDPALRAALGHHGVATAEAYGWPVIAERIDSLYDRVLAPRAAARSGAEDPCYRDVAPEP